MDYVQHKILDQIDTIEDMRDSSRYSILASLYRILLEYLLYLVFACLWSRTEDKLPRDKKNEIIMALKKPCLGDVLGAVLILNQQGWDFLNGKKDDYKKYVSQFINIRNTSFGHGMLVPGLHEATYREIYEKLREIYKELIKLNVPLISKDCKFYYRENATDSQVIVFNNTKHKYCDLDEVLLRDSGLLDNELCYMAGAEIYKLSPFISIGRNDSGIIGEYEFFCFSSYNIKNNTFEYCKISKFDDQPFCRKTYPGYFQSFQQESKYTFCKANGVICNKFENNYDYFISTDPITKYVTQVWEFIKNNRSNTCLTIRGEGGIGKTALVQYICTKYLFEPFHNKTDIEYVIFCSAKDRELKQTLSMSGAIFYVQEESTVRNYKDILNTISHVLELDVEATSEENILLIERALISKKGVLLIIDDFETFPNNEKQKIVSLIPKLNVDFHKVIITTRSQYMVGVEYYIPSLNQSQVLEFMKENFSKISESLNNDRQEKKFKEFISVRENKKIIYEMTRGLPLLTLQLGKLLMLTGFEPLDIPESWGEDVEEFLLGRLYSYFNTNTSKLLFVLISQYYKCKVTEISINDLSYIYKLYCKCCQETNVDFENDLNELEKLKILFVESSYVKICNNITNNVLERCKKRILEEYRESKFRFDDRLIKLIVDKGSEKGILEYAELEDSKFGFELVQIFALENVLSYMNDIRFQIIESYVERKMKCEDKHFLVELFTECQSFFIMEERFNEFFGKLCVQYGYMIPELEDWIIKTPKKSSPDILLAKLYTELEKVLDEIYEYLTIRRKKDIPHSYVVEVAQGISRRIAELCNYNIAELCDYDLTKTMGNVSEISMLIDEISTIKEFNMLEYEVCRRFIEHLH